MTEYAASEETFEEFKNSFSYGSRTDLNFKFLKSLSAEQAAQFLEELLWKLGDCLDDGRFERVIRHVYEGQVQAYAGEPRYKYDHGPFAPLVKPISQSRMALITSSGHFVAECDPEPFGTESMTQEDAINRILEFLRTEPTLSAIPSDTRAGRLRVRHPGYDIRSAQTDPNVVFPLERLRELERDGIIGELASPAYSFVGACSQQRLLNGIGARWANLLKEDDVEVALLVPV